MWEGEGRSPGRRTAAVGGSADTRGYRYSLHLAVFATPTARVSNARAGKRQGPSCDAQAGMVSGNTWDESSVLLGTS